MTSSPLQNSVETAEPEGQVAQAATGAPEADLVQPLRQPIGLIAPEWALRRSSRGAALWRHASVMAISAKEDVEVLCLDREASGKPFTYRDEWNVPAPGARFRVRRVRVGGRLANLSELDRARLEGIALSWVRERRPRLAHVLDLDTFGPGLLHALAAVELATLLTLERVDELRAALGPIAAPAQSSSAAQPESDSVSESGSESESGTGTEAASEQEQELTPLARSYRDALASVRRVVVRSTEDANVAQSCGAPRETIRIMAQGPDGEMAVLRAYASLYRLIGGPPSGGTSGERTGVPAETGTSSGVPSVGSAA